MKINRTDEIIKLLLEIKLVEGEIRNSSNPDNNQKSAQMVEELILRKDEFIQSDKTYIIKDKIQFSRNYNESPEIYLHRISNEVIKQRENMNIDLVNKTEFNDLNGIRIETAIRSGLLKDFIGANKEKKNEPTIDKVNKWLYRLIMIFSVILLIYFFFIQ